MDPTLTPAEGLTVDQVVDTALPHATGSARRALHHEHRERVGRVPEAYRFIHRDGGAAIVAVMSMSGRRVWIYGLSLDAARAEAIDRAFHRLDAWAAAAGAEEILIGGPPGGYLQAGIDGRDRVLVRALQTRQYEQRSTAVDLRVDTAVTVEEGEATVERAPESRIEAIVGWTRARFGSAWANEFSEAARFADGLFIARMGECFVGVGAHSGHNRAISTFGPVGVDPAARRAGLGRRLTAAILRDLQARGHREAIIPWVSPELIAFYERISRCHEVIPRPLFVRTLRREPIVCGADRTG